MADDSQETDGAAGWWGGWVQAAKDKSAEAYEFIKRDLSEFGTTVQHETRHVVSNTANTLKEKLTAENTKHVSETAGQKVKDGFVAFLGGISKALTIPPDDDDEVVMSVASHPDMFDRRKSRLRALQVDPDTYCTNPEGPSEKFERWRDTFQLDSKKGIISELLVSNVDVRGLYTKLVPSVVSNAEYWERYFYRVHLLDEDEARKLELKRRAEQTNRDEDLAWEDDSDESDLPDSPLRPHSPPMLAEQKTQTETAAPSAGIEITESDTNAEITHLTKTCAEDIKVTSESPVLLKGPAKLVPAELVPVELVLAGGGLVVDPVDSELLKNEIKTKPGVYTDSSLREEQTLGSSIIAQPSHGIQGHLPSVKESVKDVLVSVQSAEAVARTPKPAIRTQDPDLITAEPDNRQQYPLEAKIEVRDEVDPQTPDPEFKKILSVAEVEERENGPSGKAEVEITEIFPNMTPHDSPNDVYVINDDTDYSQVTLPGGSQQASEPAVSSLKPSDLQGEIHTRVRGDMVVVGVSDRNSPLTSESSGPNKDKESSSLGEDWEQDFDLDLTEEDMKLAAKSLATDDKQLDSLGDDWENWE